VIDRPALRGRLDAAASAILQGQVPRKSPSGASLAYSERTLARGGAPTFLMGPTFVRSLLADTSDRIRTVTRVPSESAMALSTLAIPRAPRASSAAVRKVMQSNRKRDTRPEVAVRRAAHALGLRYRVAARPLPGHRWTADLVFSRARVAVFVDGCFWHACPEHFSPPRTNSSYWGPKIERNQARDAAADSALAAHGWTSLRVWEHERPEDAASRIAAAVVRARGEG
jgi:DNA mismatch endonuclease, patch repair protein